MAESTVPVSKDTEAKLARIAARTGLSVGDVVLAAVEAYEARLFFEEMDETYAVLEADFREWNAYMADLTEWIGDAEPEEQVEEQDADLG
ncbi:MAG: ribbon-helix-helix protein, CopG family [Micromonosporaceae bacterium]|nr:ribbon-helix-helix protein, CopG family [Micromonosporaceae bacterium]